MRLRLVTPPAAIPVSLADAKDHLRVTDTASDALITLLLAAAVARLDGKDGELGRCLIQQTWELSLDAFPPLWDNARNWQHPLVDAITLPLAPLVSVTSVKYVDTNGVQQTLDPSAYVVDAVSEPGVITPVFGTRWPPARDQRNAITIQYVAGHATNAAGVPASLVAAIKLIVGDLFENRESGIVGATHANNPAIDALLHPYRVVAL